MDDESSLQEELEVLQSIYLDDLIICEANSITTLQMTLHPSTADKADMKYVCVTLHISLTKQYPKKEPKISIKNPRGLSDAHIASIEENLLALSLSKIGESMIYELFEYAKESLTDNNHPSCLCPICLEAFKESDKFFRTDCYHYYHIICIKGYIEVSSEKKCPVCRMNFIIDEGIFQDISTPQEDSHTITFLPDERYYTWRKNCDELFEKQKNNGGIIDLEFEKNKYLITLNSSETVPITPVTTSTTIVNYPSSSVQSKPNHQDVKNSSSVNHLRTKHSQGQSARKKTFTSDIKSHQWKKQPGNATRKDSRMKHSKISKSLDVDESSNYKHKEESEVKPNKVQPRKKYSLPSGNKNEKTGEKDQSTKTVRDPCLENSNKEISECKEDISNSYTFQRDVSLKPKPPPGFHFS